MLPCTVQLVYVSANEGRVDYFILDLKSRWSIIRVLLDYCFLRDFETWSIIRVGSIIRNARVRIRNARESCSK